MWCGWASLPHQCTRYGFSYAESLTGDWGEFCYGYGVDWVNHSLRPL